MMNALLVGVSPDMAIVKSKGQFLFTLRNPMLGDDSLRPHGIALTFAYSSFKKLSIPT